MFVFLTPSVIIALYLQSCFFSIFFISLHETDIEEISTEMILL